MEIEDYLLLHKGHGNKVLNDRRALRWMVAPLLQVWASKKVNPLKIWPLPEDKKDEMSVEQAKALLDYHRKRRAEGKKSGLSNEQKMKALEALRNESS